VKHQRGTEGASDLRERLIQVRNQICASA